MAVEKITPQLVKKGKGKKRPGYRGPGGYQGGGGRSSRSSGPAGGASAGGNYGGNRNPSQSYGGSGQGGATSPNPHTTSGTSKTSKVSAKDIERSKREFIQNLNHNNAIRAAQTGQKFTPYKGGSRPKGGMSGLGNLLMSGIGMLMGIPGLGLLKGGLGKLGSLNDKIQSTDFARSKTLMDYLDAKKYGGIDARNKAASKNMREARGIQTAMDMRPTTLDPREMARMGLQMPTAPMSKPTFSDPFANTVGTTTKVNAPASDAVSSVTRDYSGIEDYGVDINPQGSKSIFESLFPEGNLQDIIKNSKTQKDYNINATKDLVENLPGGVVKEAIAPALAGVLSPFYDGIQGIYRGATNPNKSILQALKDENIGSSMKERFTGAAAPLAERIANLNLSNPFISSAAAAEVRPAIGMENTGLGFSIPTGDVGLNASGRLGNLSATVDAIDALKGESVNPQINYSGDFGNTTAYGNFSDDVQNLGLNFNNDKGLSGGISYDAITGEPRFDIGFRRTFADGGIASMFTRRG